MITKNQNPIPNLTRDVYKAIKHMDKPALTSYLARIYMRGYEAGKKADTNSNAAASTAKDGAATE